MTVEPANKIYRELLELAIADLTVGADKIVGDVEGVGEIVITIKLAQDSPGEMYVQKYRSVGSLSGKWK